ncbi:MAG: Ig-like domain-containing protein, partial [Opitutus sp.]
MPYSLIYTPPNGAGSIHHITGVATDNSGNLLPVSQPITLNVVNAIAASTSVTISSPANNAAIPVGGVIPVAVDAHSTGGNISKVELYINGVLFGTVTTFPYSFNWSPGVVGTYGLVALAYDDKNNVIASTTSLTATSTPAPTTVTIAAPPTVTVTSPQSGTTITGGAITQIIAAATDSNTDASGNPVTISSVQ